MVSKTTGQSSILCRCANEVVSNVKSGQSLVEINIGNSPTITQKLRNHEAERNSLHVAEKINFKNKKDENKK